MNTQARHYDGIIETYDAGYFDEWSVRYRETYVYEPLFRGLDLSDTTLLEVGCGSGLNVRWLKDRHPGLKCYGVDVSPRAIERFAANNPDCEGAVFDLTTPGLTLGAQVDFCLGIGVLHHCVRDLDTTIANIHGALREGGRCLLFEPNGRGVLNDLRKLWYRVDPLFDEDNERALGVGDIAKVIGGRFAVESVRYFGGVAYFAILNSAALRIPRKLKKLGFPLAMALERASPLWSGERLSPCYLLRLKKIP